MKSNRINKNNLNLLLVLISIGLIVLSISATSVSTSWVTNGVPICTEINDQYNIQIISDGEGGAIIIWQDERIGSFKIYAQRIDHDGHIQWAPNGTAVAIREVYEAQYYPQVCNDGIGGVIIVWENRDVLNYGDIYAQRIDSEGNRLWTSNGKAISSLPRLEGVPQICSDGAGGAIITWDYLINGTEVDIYAQYVDSNGNLLWMDDGLAICTTNGIQHNPRICSDGEGGAIIAWDGGGCIYAQKINLSGNIQWVPNGTAICTANGGQQISEICSDGTGGTIITWEDGRSGYAYRDIYAQRIDLNGIIKWNINGTPICTAIKEQRSPKVLSDGYNGAFIIWNDNRRDLNWEIYMQRVNSEGNIMWTLNGIQICNEPSWVTDICYDGNGGIMIVWSDYRNYIDTDIYAQNVDSNGNLLWMDNGLAICTTNGSQYTPQICSDGIGGAIIAWDDSRKEVSDRDIYAQRIINSKEKMISFGDCYILFLIFNMILLLVILRKRLVKK